MNINKINQTNAVEAYKNIKKEMKTKNINKKTMKDALILSENGKIFQNALKEVSNRPDIRQDKVNEISKSIKNGTYTVDSKGIAQKILNGANFSKLV